jgi:aminopeptidase 2
MIADAGSLAASGYQKSSGILSLLDSFKGEPDFVVWQEITGRIGSLRGAWMFEGQTIRDAMKQFQLDLVKDKAHELGWTFSENDGHIEQQFKSLMFGAAGISGDEQITKASFDMFSKFKTGDKSAIHPNIRGSVYAIVLAKGGKEEVSAAIRLI